MDRGIGYDLKFIDYWKMCLRDYSSDKELYEFLIDYRQADGEEDVKFIEKGFLGSEMLRRIYLDKDPIGLVLRVHLIFDSFLDIMLSKSKLNSKKLKFKQKLDLLKARRRIRSELHTNLIEFNKLRNKYAHNLYYDLADYDINNFTVCSNFYSHLSIKSNKTRAVLNFKTLQFYILPDLLEKFLKSYPYLIESKLKKKTAIHYYREDAGDMFGKIVRKLEKYKDMSDLGMKISIELETKKPGE